MKTQDSKGFALLRLMRPPNLLTALADVLAGASVASAAVPYVYLKTDAPPLAYWPLLLLGLATIGLYAGGVVFNDVFDAELDAQERPERPIPKGVVSKQEATSFGTGLLVGGVVLAGLANGVAGLLAALIGLLALTYDAYGKHHALLGPLNMGLCRGLNLLLGMALFPETLALAWPLAFIPVVYIAAITAISRGEVHGGHAGTLLMGGLMYGLAILGILLGARFLPPYWVRYHYDAPLPQGLSLVALLYVCLFAWFIYQPWFKAYQSPSPGNIMKAVKWGVISLIVMDAALAAAFSPWWHGGAILLLLPISRAMAKIFAVT